MKMRLTFLAVFVAAFFSGFAQQVPNAGFETWTNAVTPQYWTSLENIFHINNNVFTYKDSIDVFSGSASIKLVSDSVPGYPVLGVFSAETSLGAITVSGQTQTLIGIPFAYRPDTFFFEYQYTTPGIDTASVLIQLTKNYSTNVLVVQPHITAHSTWTRYAFCMTPYYSSGVTPDTLILQFKSSNTRATAVKGSTLHVDSLSFAYATVNHIFVANITPNGPTTFCTGDSVVLQANTGSGYTYQWQLNGNNMFGATNSKITVKSSGSYTVIVDSSGTIVTSSPTVVTVNQPPVVTFTGLNDTVCRSAGSIALGGGNPPGGSYSGPGVTASSFSPQSANLGINTIVYSVGSGNCMGSASATITVVQAAVSLAGLNDSVCNNASAITLSGGAPSGGTYSGSGVTASTFTPQSATVGVDTITYTSTDANNCTGSAKATITVLRPNVTLSGLNDTVCSNASAITLNGGSPAGGTYSGSGVTASTFTPQSAALGLNTIVYTATDANNCTGSASGTIYVEICGGINSIAGVALSVYPNPAANQLNINATENLEGFGLHIYDVMGKLVIGQILQTGNNTINIDKLANGSYIYTVTDKGSHVIAQSKFDVLK